MEVSRTDACIFLQIRRRPVFGASTSEPNYLLQKAKGVLGGVRQDVQHVMMFHFALKAHAGLNFTLYTAPTHEY